MTILAVLYTDEDMSALVVTLLRSRGLDVTTVPEQVTLGKTDREQLEERNFSRQMHTDS